MSDLYSVPAPSGAPPAPAPPSPSAPSTGLLGPAEAEARVKAIYADTSHPFHRGDPRATAEVYQLHQAIHGTEPVAGGPQIGSDPAAALKGPVEHESLRAFGDSFEQAGVPPAYGQAIVDVVTGFKSDLPDPPAGYVPMTADAGAAALAATLGPAEAQQEIAKAQRVIDVVKSISPEVKARLEYALDASGAGNLPGHVRAFARLYDLSANDARTLLMQTFGAEGAKAADRLFGPAPRRGRTP
jgi:hypothetical protein